MRTDPRSWLSAIHVIDFEHSDPDCHSRPLLSFARVFPGGILPRATCTVNDEKCLRAPKY
jgi:hypothetical protein